MRLGLFVPLLGDPAGLRDYLAAAAVAAERAGFHSLRFAEHVVLYVSAPTADGVRAEIETLAATLLPVAASLGRAPVSR